MRFCNEGFDWMVQRQKINFIEKLIIINISRSVPRFPFWSNAHLWRRAIRSHAIWPSAIWSSNSWSIAIRSSEIWSRTIFKEGKKTRANFRKRGSLHFSIQCDGNKLPMTREPNTHALRLHFLTLYPNVLVILCALSRKMDLSQNQTHDFQTKVMAPREKKFPQPIFNQFEIPFRPGFHFSDRFDWT